MNDQDQRHAGGTLLGVEAIDKATEFYGICVRCGDEPALANEVCRDCNFNEGICPECFDDRWQEAG